MSFRIVCLDGYTLNPGDLTWQPFEALGELTVHDRSPEKLVVERTGDAPVILTNKTIISADAIAKLPALKYIGVLATGTNVVDLDAATKRRIVVTNVPGYGTDSVAQHTIALLLELANQPAAHSRAVHGGHWTRCEDFSFTVGPIVELAGKTFGIVGLGAIGKQVARIGAALGMTIAAAGQPGRRARTLRGIDIHWCDIDELFRVADVITLHCPLTEATRHVVNARRLSLMKRSAFLINTGRGPLVDEAALSHALRDGAIAGAALDVLGVEPPKANNPLLNCPRCLITPHCAWASLEARSRLMRIAADNLGAFIDGKPVNQVK